MFISDHLYNNKCLNYRNDFYMSNDSLGDRQLTTGVLSFWFN